MIFNTNVFIKSAQASAYLVLLSLSSNLGASPTCLDASKPCGQSVTFPVCGTVGIADCSGNNITNCTETVCQGSPVTLQALVPTGSHIFWTLNGKQISPCHDSEFCTFNASCFAEGNFTPGMPNCVCVQITDANGTSCKKTNNAIVCVTYDSVASPQASPITVDVCSGNPITLSAPDGSPAGTAWCWTTPNSTTCIPGQMITIPAPVPSGTYTVTASNGTACCNNTNGGTTCCSNGVTGCCSSMCESVVLNVVDCPKLCVNKCSSPTAINPGQSFKYVIRVLNCGTAPATGVVVTDMLPPCLTINPADIIVPTGWTAQLKAGNVLIVTPNDSNSVIMPCDNLKIKVLATATSCPPPSISNLACATADGIPTPVCSSPTITTINTPPPAQ